MVAEQTCPGCGTTVRRIHRRGLVARLRKALTGRRSFQCQSCGWQGWLTPMDLGTYTPIDPVEPPDVTAIDAVLGPAADTRETFTSDKLK